MTLALVNLGYGNIASVALACKRLGTVPVITADPATIAGAERVILPGVGAAGFAMRRIHELKLETLLPTLTAPVLGICLGMHLLFDGSDEDGTDCLGILPGRVRSLDPAPGLPVPHMGWSRLDVADPTIELDTGDYVYFAHSFAADNGPATIATAMHSRAIPAVVRRNNYLGAQFHPERSGPAGARFLEAFLS